MLAKFGILSVPIGNLAVCFCRSSYNVVVNPANQLAAQSVARNARLQFTRASSLRNRDCAAGGMLAAVVNETGGYVGSTRPSCAASVGYATTCTATTGLLWIDGRWFIGRHAGTPGAQQRDFGPPHAAGRFALTIRNYSPSWQGNFTRGEQRSSGTSNGAAFSVSLPCHRTYPIPQNAEVTFVLTRTVGTETPELRALIQGLAHEVIADQYCDRMRRATSSSVVGNLGEALLQRLTWQTEAAWRMVRREESCMRK